MDAQLSAAGSAPAESDSGESSNLYQDGIVAGTIGATTIAVWFLLLDTIKGRPFYTPTVLGTVLFQRGGTLPSPETLPPSFQLVLVYTWVHWLVFCVIGGVVSRLLVAAERKPDLGFGILLLFVVFEFGFLVAAMLFSEVILRALAWQEILLGNLLAAAAMGGYFWRRHPHLTIRP
ncbi:MAG: hypothetical protein HYS14_08060 [Candidatus Rokubacteria bacterium]|nr:hypothetical protein [Candidatus Rokubacteria bacterium]